MTAISTEPIGSIPRPAYLQNAMQAFQKNEIREEELSDLFAKATRETILQLEATGSPVLSDGEQSKPSFATYAVAGKITRLCL